MFSFTFPDDLHGFHIHFTGIKGTGMAALVEILFSRGAVITGSDVAERFYTDEILDELNIIPALFSADNITDDIQLVIHSSAYNRSTHPELVAADKKNIPVLLYTEALGLVSKAAYSCGICGVHGKTTTTGLTGSVLKQLNFPAQVLAGSIINSFGNGDGRCTLSIGHKYFIAETCEYQRHFMSFHPQKIILTSVESDHQDYYPTYNDIRDAFIDYIMLLPVGGDLIYCADDKGAVDTANIAKSKRSDINLIPYGLYAEGDYKISLASTENKNRICDGIQYFNLAGFDGDFALCVPGHHLVLNATAAVALSIRLLQQENKIDKESLSLIKKGLLSFVGAKRRSEVVGRTNNTVFVDDYGHHPTAVKTTLSGYREFYPDRRIIVDFMSHTYTRTASLLDEFSECFGDADEVILHKIYPSAREHYTGLVSGRSLYDKVCLHHNNVRYYEEIMDSADDLLSELSNYEKSGQKVLFVTMGAGDNWKIGRYLFDTISKIN